MNRRIAVLGMALASMALLAASAVGTAFAQTPGGGYGPGWGCGPGGMMGSYWGPNAQPGPGGRGGWGMGPGMMGGWRGGAQPTGNPIGMDQAQQVAEQVVGASGYPNLVIDEIMEFQRNFYVDVKEKDSGVHAFELLVDRYTGATYPEPGPNMMWNTKYGMMAGMMGRGMMGGYSWWGGTPQQPTADMPVKADQPVQRANDFLAQAFAGAKAADDPATFYGYYTLDFSKDGKTLGMLSVNGYSGQVWLHTWHGDFIDEKEIGSR